MAARDEYYRISGVCKVVAYFDPSICIIMVYYRSREGGEHLSYLIKCVFHFIWSVGAFHATEFNVKKIR